MPIKTAEDFLSVLERSSLLSPAEFAQVRELSADIPDATQFAKILARNEIITFWQAGHLLQGRSSFLLGKYRLIDLLGRGGMGSVFLASHVVMHRKVALKFIPERIAKNPAALERFLAEARTVAALDHPNIVRAYSVDNEGNRYYLVLEYVEGMDLQRAVEAYGPLDLEAAVDYLRQAADGLAHAHARKMIHCDIKPSNLIVTEEGVVKILDMGLARLVHDKPGAEAANGPENHALGSVDYLAPEQAVAAPDFNHRADIYALGCTLYFLLTGHPPFPSGTLAQRIVKHQTLEPEEIGIDRPETPASLAAICKKMMAKNPADRYQTADEVREVLAAWQPVVHQPAKKTIAIKKIETLEDFSTVSPWEQEFGEELKNLAASSKANDSGPPPGMSGKMPAVKSGSSSVKLKKILAGTRERLILTSCAAAVLLVFLVAGIILAVVYSGKPSTGSAPVTQSSETPRQLPPPTPPGVPVPPPPPAPESPTKTVVKKTSNKTRKPPKPKPAVPPDAPPKREQADSSTASIQQPAPQEANASANPDLPPAPLPPADPLKGLAFALDLPDVSAGSSAGVSLGKVRLDAQAKLQIELVGGDKVGKTFGYALQEDPNAVGGQAWNISRSDARGKSLPAARLKLKEGELYFDWAQIPPVQANPLRNCGLAISTGDAKRFLQFRFPKSADPLILDFDKGTTAVHLRAENLPDPDIVKLKIDPLKKPFPENNANPDPAPTPTKKMVEIVFNDPKYSLFSIRAVCELSKRNQIDLDASAVLPNKVFKFAAGETFLKEMQTDLARKKRQFNNAKNNPPLKDNLKQQVADAEEALKKFAEVMKLSKKLNNQVIHYRIVADYEGQPVVLFDSLLAPPAEATETAE
ncbi:MAG: serine/threonine protein kinase [Pirellulales bacterium]|nr:serine/threonine protein kinase [Pirellulales bacterium]